MEPVKPKVELTGIILAGGKGMRMGQVKPLVLFEGVTLLERVVRILESAMEDVIIVTSDSIAKTLNFKNRAKVVTDHFPGNGPLSGLYTGLKYSTSEFNFVVSCDMPFINLDIARVLAESITGFDAAVPSIHGKPQPLHGVYSRACCCLLYTSPSPRDGLLSRMPSSA